VEKRRIWESGRIEDEGWREVEGKRYKHASVTGSGRTIAFSFFFFLFLGMIESSYKTERSVAVGKSTIVFLSFKKIQEHARLGCFHI